MEYSLSVVDEFKDSPRELIEWMNEERFLNTDDILCPTHQRVMRLQESRKHTHDLCALRCPAKKCRTTRSVRHDSWFSGSKLTLHKQLRLLLFFVADVPEVSTELLLEVSHSTTSIIYNRCRTQYASDLENDPIEFDDGEEYEVDETYIGHVYNDESDAYENIWVAGILERATQKVILYRVPDKTAPTLCDPIIEHVPAGSKVYTDSLHSYTSGLEDEDYHHLTVNHSAGEYSREDEVDDEEVTVHINSLESTWHHLKSKAAHKTNRTIERVDLLLSEYMYRHSGNSLFEPFKYFE
jgi:hypothetical protein